MVIERLLFMAWCPVFGASLSSVVCSQETCYWNFGADCLTSPPTVTGNLAWAMQLWHYVYLYTQDEQALRDLYPLLRRTVCRHNRWHLLR